MDTYWADSTGRRNTFDHIRFKQAVERFWRRTITQRFARPAIKGMRYSAELIGSVLAQICTLREVLTAYSNETGQEFRSLTGRLFQRYTGRGSEAKPDGRNVSGSLFINVGVYRLGQA